MDLFEENIRTWTMDYVNLNNNIYVIVYEACDELIEIEKENENFKMRIK